MRVQLKEDSLKVQAIGNPIPIASKPELGRLSEPMSSLACLGASFGALTQIHTYYKGRRDAGGDYGNSLVLASRKTIILSRIHILLQATTVTIVQSIHYS